MSGNLKVSSRISRGKRGRTKTVKRMGTVNARAIHRTLAQLNDYPLTISADLPLDMIVKPVRQIEWGWVVLSAILAVGLCSVFIWPLVRWSQPDEPTGGTVLGQTISVPLRVEVQVKLDNQTSIMTVSPVHGTLTEVVALTANQASTSFLYQSRGSSIYLSEFAGRTDNQTGHWIVAVNGLTQPDLSQAELRQGDRVLILYQPVNP